MEETQTVLVEQDPPVALIRLNRPQVLHAINFKVLAALCEALEALDADPQFRVIVLTGDERAFAAGADVGMLAGSSPLDILTAGTRPYWDRIWRISKPLIAAVSGFAYGGGCELALGCDLIVASETARFAQPEIKLGIMPGAGGTQRLAKALGPYLAMEMVLTGEPISAAQAQAHGLVNRVVPMERYLEEALELARLIASRPPVAVRMAREALRHGVANTLREGLELERRNYAVLYDTYDQAEGMQAFLENRPPRFRGK